MRTVILVAALVTAGPLQAAGQVRDGGQVAPTGTAQVVGRVTTADGAATPLRRVAVTLTGDRLSAPLMAITDDGGAFAFTNLPAGRYSVTAAKAAYVPMAYGSKRAGGAGTPILVADAGRAVVTVELPKGSVITGTVRDDFGRPVPGVIVSVQRMAMDYQTGERVPQGVRFGSEGQVRANYLPNSFPGTAVTDDRGGYRIYGLPAGEYIVSAVARPRGSPSAVTDIRQTTDADLQRARLLLRGVGAGAGTSTSVESAVPVVSPRVDYVPVYHPAAIMPGDAATIVLSQAEERAGIDVMLRFVSTAAVTGTVTGPDGLPVAGLQVSVIDPLSTSGAVFRTTRSDSDGGYVIGGIPPGRFEVQAGGSASGHSGRVEVMVAGRDVFAPITLEPPVRVSGRIVFDGESVAPSLTAVRLWMTRRPLFLLGGTGFGQGAADGRFAFSVAAGSYRLRINGRPPAGWTLRSAMLNGADVSDIAFEVKAREDIEGMIVTLTDRAPELSGTLLDATGAPAPEYTLVVFSADSKFWVPETRRTQHVRPDAEGRYVATGLPAGDYFVAVVTDLDDGEWNERAFLAELAASGPIKVALTEGQKTVQDIRISAR
jgi:uncharacterized protein (DUF2141 family)